jgi:hypothetical protein
MADVDCYAESRLSLRVMVCGVFLIKFQYETKFYLLALIFFVNMWIPDGFANDLSINVTKSSYTSNYKSFAVFFFLPACNDVFYLSIISCISKKSFAYFDCLCQDIIVSPFFWSPPKPTDLITI